MNQKNYQYLTETLASLGFDTFFNDQLKTKLQLGIPEFSLIGDNKRPDGVYVRYEPQLTKSKDPNFSDYYFLNAIKATAKDMDGTVKASAEFKIFKKSGFTVQQMENLLVNGHPVHKEFVNSEGDKEGKWYRLDLKNLDENGHAQMISYSDQVTRLNLERELDKLNIVWGNKTDKQDTIRDLKDGEKIGATVKESGKLVRISLEVAPQLGGLVVRNNEGQVIKYTNSQAQSMQAVAEEQVNAKKGLQANMQQAAKVVQAANKSVNESQAIKPRA